MLRTLINVDKSLSNISHNFYVVASPKACNRKSFVQPKVVNIQGYWCSYLDLNEGEYNIGWETTLPQAVEYSNVIDDYSRKSLEENLERYQNFLADVKKRGKLTTTDFSEAILSRPWRVMINLESTGADNYVVMQDAIFWDDKTNSFYVAPNTFINDTLIPTNVISFVEGKDKSLIEMAEKEKLDEKYFKGGRV